MFNRHNIGDYVRWRGNLARVEDVLYNSALIKFVGKEETKEVALGELRQIHLSVIRNESEDTEETKKERRKSKEE